MLLTRQVTGTEDRYTEPLLKRVVATQRDYSSIIIIVQIEVALDNKKTVVSVF